MRQDLAGVWQFMLDRDKEGIRKEYFKRTSFEDTISLPTTTAEAQKGDKGLEKLTVDQCTGHLTETYHFEGYAWYLREIEIPEIGLPMEEAGKRFFFVMERTRKSTVWVDGNKAGSFDSFYVEHRYELTQWLTPGKHVLTVMIDNTDYLSGGGHMTSPDTQTNWNGIVGRIYMETVQDINIERMWIYPSRTEKKADIKLELSCSTMHGTEAEPESSFRVQVSCKCTRLEKKEGRDYEHFEPAGIQAAGVRDAWRAEKREEDLPYCIRVLETLPDKTYPLSQCEPADMGRDIKADTDTSGQKGIKTAKFMLTYPLGSNAREWDEYHPNVYEMTVRILRGEDVLCERTSHFGLRDFTYRELKLYCNDQEIFLRGTHDGLSFPLTGYAPMDLASWIHVYGTSKEYGLNHYRYHTCCPPAAAFLAAAYLGIYVQAELAFWGSIYEPEDECCDKAQQDFLLEEGIRALDAFGDMPSYFGMSMGNELWGSKQEINRMMGVLKAHDNRHLYTQGSNNHQFVPSVLPNDDFFSGVRFSKNRLFRGSYAMCDAPLGFVQTQCPGAYWDYDEMISPEKIKKVSVAKGGTIQIQYGTGIKEVEIGAGEEEVIPHVPVISHEIGQYEFTPDYSEIACYTGVLQPENLKIFRQRLEEKGLSGYAQDYFRASGKLAAACYKLELEAAFRSANLSGFQLLDIKDYTGQGTALVGILNAFMVNKGAITKQDWRMFCSDAVLLPTLDRFVMKSGEQIKSVVKLRYYRPEKLDCTQVKATWYLKKKAGEVSGEGQLQEVSTQTMPCAGVSGRGLFTLGEMALKVPECRGNAIFLLRFALCGDSGAVRDVVNEYSIFIYEETALHDRAVEDKTAGSRTDDKEPDGMRAEYQKNGSVCITNDNRLALAECKNGKAVLLFVKPDSVAENDTIQGDYCTDFWCYPMFRSISESAGKPVPVGTMGLLIDDAHPALSGFATEQYTTAQWYQTVMHSRPMILDSIKAVKTLKPIVRVMDNFERNHNLGLIYEMKQGAGRLLVCHADLITLKESCPEAACLYYSLADYVASEAFMPQYEKRA